VVVVEVVVVVDDVVVGALVVVVVDVVVEASVVVVVVDVVVGASVVVVVVGASVEVVGSSKASQALAVPGVPSSPSGPYVVTDVHQLEKSRRSTDGDRSAAEAPTAYGNWCSGVHATRSTGTSAASYRLISSELSTSGKAAP